MSCTTRLTIALLAALAFPAAAAADTITVDGKAGTATCSGTTCKTITAALDLAKAGDTINVAPGVYTEPPLVADTANVSINGQPGAVLVTNAAGAAAGTPLMRISGAGVRLTGLVMGIAADGGQTVLVQASDVRIESCTLVKQVAVTQDLPTLAVADTVTGTTTVLNSFIIHQPDLPEPADPAVVPGPAVAGSAEGTLVMTGVAVASGPEGGDAVSLRGNSVSGDDPIPNRIERSALAAFHPNADALQFVSGIASPDPKAARVDSSTLVGGSSGGAGLRALSEDSGDPLTNSQAGDMNVTMVQVTVAGAARGAVIQALANGAGIPVANPVGSIHVSVDRSIFHGTNVVENNDGTIVIGAANSASLQINRSDTPQEAAEDTGTQILVSGNVNNPDTALFVNPLGRDYHLRADSPARDAGGNPEAGDSQFDVDGEPRLNGAKTDLGGDEFHNKRPLAKLAGNATSVREGQAVVFDASGSVDPEAGQGGGLTSYRWDYGDGTTETTTTPTVSHPYGKRGTYAARVTVVDNMAGVSEPSAPFTLTVTDGTAPVVRIVAPRSKAVLRRFRTTVRKLKSGKTRRTRRTLTHRFAGTATDEAGIQSVEMSFELTKLASRTTRSSAAGQCRYLDHKKHSIVGRSCRRPLFFPVSIRNDVFAYRTKKKTKLRPGSYTLTVRVTDKNGVQATTTLPFTVR